MVFVLLVDATLSDGCGVSKNLQSFRDGWMDGWVYKTFRLSPIVVEHTLVVMTAGSQSRRSQIESYWQPIFDSRFIKFVFRIRDLVEDSDTGGPSSITVTMEYLFAFQF